MTQPSVFFRLNMTSCGLHICFCSYKSMFKHYVYIYFSNIEHMDMHLTKFNKENLRYIALIKLIVNWSVTGRAELNKC